MKNRLHDKKAGIAILAVLIVLSLAELIFRATVIREAALTTSNLGEQFAVFALAVTILILSAKGKDRACYICYGAWIASFVMEQIFVLPGDIITAVTLNNPSALAIIIRSAAALTSVGIIAIGAMLVEYMNDGFLPTFCRGLGVSGSLAGDLTARISSSRKRLTHLTAVMPP